MKLADIAARIYAHLKRFEADHAISRRKWTDGQGRERENTLYYHPGARAAGSRVSVTYVTYQGDSCLTKADALAYLAWLDAGNIGTHYEWRRVAPQGASQHPSSDGEGAQVVGETDAKPTEQKDHPERAVRE